MNLTARTVWFSFAACLSLRAAINVPLTVEEALYPSDPTGTTTGMRGGIARTNDPVTVGIPLPNDASGVNSIAALGLSGASLGQFRVLACWGGGTPTGTPATSCGGGTNIKWVLVDTQASLNSGTQNTGIALTTGGTGNFGGSNLAIDNGPTITVATGAMTVTIQKANTDIFHTVVVGGTTIVAAGTSGGLAIMGPASPGTSCGSCTTAYTSVNDSSSTAVIEENGPAKAVIKISGQHKDSSGNAYMRYDARLYFYAGRTYVKVTSVLHNADYGASNTFATAFKGLRSYELRIKANISGTLNWKIAGDSSVCTSGVCSGTMSGTDYTYIYQGKSNSMTSGTLALPVAYTSDTGYTIRNNTTTLATGDAAHFPTGWADIADASGNGMLIGTYQIAGLGPKSLEFDAGGSDVRVGIWASENGNPTGGPGNGTAAYYQAWPERKIHDFFVEFHTSAPASPAADFLKLQHFLVGHAAYTWYNTTAALTTGSSWPLINPAVEDNFWSSSTFKNSKPYFSGISYTGRDLGTDGNSNYPLNVYRYYSWEGGGGGNQVEFHWSRLLNMIRRDWTGGYLDAFHFYRFVAQNGYPYLYGDAWSNHTGDIDQQGYPQQASANYSNVYTAPCCRHDFAGQEHAHDYGAPDYYYLTGDQSVYDAIVGGMVDMYSSSYSSLYGNKGGYINPRSNAAALLHGARLHNFLTSIGDSAHAIGVQNQALSVYTKQIRPDLCVSGYPSGCTYTGTSPNAAGTSRVRGMTQGTYQNTTIAEGALLCSNTSPYRIAGAFQVDILLGGEWEFRNEMGSGWQYYTELFDIMYGQSQFALTEDFYDDGTGSWSTSGNRYYLALDAANNVPVGCAAAGNSFDYYTPKQNNGIETTWNRYYIQNQYNGSTGWRSKALVTVQRNIADGNVDDPNHYQLAQVLNAIGTVPAQSLTAATITAVSYSAPNYSVTINVPAGAASYRAKCSTSNALSIVEWIGFDPGTNTWIGNPATQQNWFAATEISGLPAPSGTTQTFTIAASACGGQTNLTAPNFMVKAWASLPNNTWVTRTTHGVPIGQPGWEKLTYNPDLGKFLKWGNYHDANSEANNGLFAYDYETNTWTLVSRTEPYHDEHFPESGHQDGEYLVFDPVNHIHLGLCCGSGSSGFEGVYHTWEYDLGAQIGLERQTFSTSGATISPDRPAEPTSAYMPSVGTYVLLAGGRGTWRYDIGTPGSPANAWTNLSPTCTVQGGGSCIAAWNVLTATASKYNPGDGCSYLYGGADGSSGPYSPYLFKGCYSGAIFTWTQMTPSNPPPGRGWAALSVDTAANVMLMFGGKCGNGGQTQANCSGSSALAGMTDLWAYSFSGNTWTQLSPAGTPPAVGNNPAFELMDYDPVHNVHILTWLCTNPCAPYADAPSYNAGLYSGATTFYRYAGSGPSPGITSESSPGVSVSAVNPLASKVQPGARTRNVNGWAQKAFMVAGNGLITVARTELGTPFDTGSQTPYPTPYVDSWNGTAWSQWTVSMSGSCGSGGMWYSPAPAYAGGQWWLVTYGSYGQNRRMYVTSASGTTFSVNCASPFTLQGSSTGGSEGGQVFDVGGMPYFVDLETTTANSPPTHNQIYVYSYSGGVWSLVGSGALNAAGTAAQTAGFSGASDGSGHPCVAWADYAVHSGDVVSTGQSQVHLSCYIGGSWTVQGGGVANVSANNWATDPSLTYLSGVPYVAFTERTATGYAQLYVRQVSAGSWVTVGSGSLNIDPNGNGWAFHPSLTSDNTANLYLGWVEYQPPHTYVSGEPIEQRGQAYVYKWNGSSWAPIGGALNADALYGSAQRISLAYSTKPYAVWNEANPGTSTQQIYVEYWTGSAWNATPYNIVPTSLTGAPFTATETIPTTTFSDPACTSPTWSLSNAPTGLSINSSGVVNGTLGSGSAATYSTASVGDGCTTQVLGSFVVNATPSITTSSLPSGTVGTSYSQTLATSGGTAPLVCSVSAGILPTGTSLNGSCNISGTPTAVGVFSFTAKVTDANAITGSQPLSISISSVPGFFVSGGTCSGCRF
jgi:hypothetical protein